MCWYSSSGRKNREMAQLRRDMIRLRMLNIRAVGVSRDSSGLQRQNGKTDKCGESCHRSTMSCRQIVSPCQAGLQHMRKLGDPAWVKRLADHLSPVQHFLVTLGREGLLRIDLSTCRPDDNGGFSFQIDADHGGRRDPRPDDFPAVRRSSL
jgi:hypothetical protein